MPSRTLNTQIEISRLWVALVVLAGGVSAACADTLPDDIADYRSRCVKMNRDPIPRTGDDDPHDGNKDVYACDVPLVTLEANQRPFSDGAVFVKESTRDDVDFPWLIATARRVDGEWQWNEYTRNFESEEFVEILASEQVCIDCHVAVESIDWIYTQFEQP